MTPESRAPIIISPWYRKRWFKRLAVVSILILAVVSIMAVAAAVIWQNSSERKLLDAANYAVKTPGVYHVTAQATDLNVTLRDQMYAASGTINGMPIDAIFYSGMMYVKSPQPEKLYDFFMGSGKAGQLSIIARVLAPTIANKWISVNLSNITLESQNAQMIQCLSQEKESISHNPNARSQWASTYLGHRFLAISANKKPLTTTYQVSVNHKTRADFFASLQKTSFYQSLTTCSKDTDVLDSLGGISPAASVTLTNNHILQSMIIGPRSKNPVTVTANYKNVPSILVPTDAIGVEQLIIHSIGSLGNFQ